mgnify:CR=1 FL=1
MALTGCRPVVELRVVDFALCATDEIVNQAAKNRYMFGGQGRVPLVLRMPMGIWSAAAAQHSQSLEAWFAHIPGLVVVAPATAADNYGLMHAALACGDPVAYMEHKELWALPGEVVPGQVVPLGQARTVREGSDLTLVSWSRQIHACAQAAEALAAQGIQAEVIDLRSLRPMDTGTIIRSVQKTNRCVTVEEGWPVCSIGNHISAVLMQQAFDWLDAPVINCTGKDVPMPYAANLEKLALVTADEVVAAVKSVTYR